MSYYFEGWDDGIMGLCVSAKASLIIPPEFGYGERGIEGNVPGGATLYYNIEVVSINEPPPMAVEGNLFVLIDEDGNGTLTENEVES
jgi:FKBP-type peptidyl-prolyl cis-trans isomerase 2